MFNRVRFLLNPGREDTPRAPWIMAIELARLMFVLVLFLVLVAVFLLFWHVTHPIVVKEPLYVEFQSGGNNFVRIAAAGEDVTNNQALISMEMRRYVSAREPVDGMSDYTADKYATVHYMSCDPVWNAFKNKYGGENGILARKEFRRDVRIISDSRLADGAHQVVFQTRDWLYGVTDRDSAPWQTWTASLGYSFDTSKRRFDDVGMNPTGIQICEYNLARSAQQ